MAITTLTALVWLLTLAACSPGPGFGAAVSASGSTQAEAPDARFLPAAGATLAARRADALSRGRSATASHFWIAYRFDVRPGVAVDVDGGPGDRTMTFDGVRVIGNAPRETRNLGVFILHARSSDAPDRIEIYNLDRRRDFAGHPVFWLGQAPSDESFALLDGLMRAHPVGWIAERAVVAVSLHEDARAAELLDRCARDGSLSREARKHAATGLGIRPGFDSLARIAALYGSTGDPAIRMELVTAAGIHKSDDGSADGSDFLIRVAESEKNRECRRQAIFWLGQMAGDRTLSALERAVDRDDDEIREHAVFAIGQRPRDEAVPLLMKIARTHASHAVRRSAIYWLSQMDDERVLTFLKEVLAN